MKTLLALLALLTILPSAGHGQQQGWFHYDPSVSRIQGNLIQVTKYGKPTYGSEPETDEKVEVPILVLPTPIRVRTNPERRDALEPMTNVSFVQLIFPDDPAGNLKKYLDQTIVVSGTLALGRRGGHFTDVVMTVKVVNPTGKPL
ncbi:MAG: DUF4431 domain-containing protein [Deltaproteobacteria bacterium]|nr:DUF4431 domain-containing protein [Deltaproteobacteria bacterium]